MRNKQQKGFTLIELLVVIVILGILSTISVGTFRGYFSKARDAERLAAVTTISTMIQVDSAGFGDCRTYNLGNNAGSDCADASLTALKVLLEANDYDMPDSKNGLVYYYGFAKQGDDNNDFFVMIGAEDSGNQSAETMAAGTGGLYTTAFVAGTTEGIYAVKTNCTVTDAGVIAACATSDSVPVVFTLYSLDEDGVFTAL